MTTRLKSSNGLPPAQGLYDPAHEHDACGIGFVASISGHKSHDIIRKGIQVLLNLAHRGACGCDPETGDGAGVLIQILHKFFARECEKLGFALPKPGAYGVGMTFLPVEKHQRLQCEGILERIIRDAVSTGRYSSVDDVLSDALTRLRRTIDADVAQLDRSAPPGASYTAALSTRIEPVHWSGAAQTTPWLARQSSPAAVSAPANALMQNPASC